MSDILSDLVVFSPRRWSEWFFCWSYNDKFNYRREKNDSLYSPAHPTRNFRFSFDRSAAIALYTFLLLHLIPINTSKNFTPKHFTFGFRYCFWAVWKYEIKFINYSSSRYTFSTKIFLFFSLYYTSALTAR